MKALGQVWSRLMSSGRQKPKRQKEEKGRKREDTRYFQQGWRHPGETSKLVSCFHSHLKGAGSLASMPFMAFSSHRGVRIQPGLSFSGVYWLFWVVGVTPLNSNFHPFLIHLSKLEMTKQLNLQSNSLHLFWAICVFFLVIDPSGWIV